MEFINTDQPKFWICHIKINHHMDIRIYREILCLIAWQNVNTFCRGKIFQHLFNPFILTSKLIWSLKLSYLMVMSFALSLIPGFLSFLKLPIYNWAAKTCFRILSRSFSGVIQFHNKEYRPKSDGICVANHTTPIDVVVLSCDRSYALVNNWDNNRLLRIMLFLN